MYNLKSVNAVHRLSFVNSTTTVKTCDTVYQELNKYSVPVRNAIVALMLVKSRSNLFTEISSEPQTKEQVRLDWVGKYRIHARGLVTQFNKISNVIINPDSVVECIRSILSNLSGLDRYELESKLVFTKKLKSKLTALDGINSWKLGSNVPVEEMMFGALLRYADNSKNLDTFLDTYFEGTDAPVSDEEIVRVSGFYYEIKNILRRAFFTADMLEAIPELGLFKIVLPEGLVNTSCPDLIEGAMKEALSLAGLLASPSIDFIGRKA